MEEFHYHLLFLIRKIDLVSKLTVFRILREVYEKQKEAELFNDFKVLRFEFHSEKQMALSNIRPLDITKPDFYNLDIVRNAVRAMMGIVVFSHRRVGGS